MRSVFVLSVAILASLVVAQTAGAATVTPNPATRLAAATFVAAPGEANDVTVSSRTGTSSSVTITDSGAPLTLAGSLASACTSPDAHTVTCPWPGQRYAAQVNAGDRNDVVTAAGDTPLSADGGSGRNRLVGGTEHDSLSSAHGGDDTLIGGAGPDIFRVSDRRTDVHCGGGSDVVNEEVGAAGRWSKAQNPTLTADCESLVAMDATVDGPYVSDVYQLKVALTKLRRHGATVTLPVTAFLFGRNSPFSLAAILQPPTGTKTLARLTRRLTLGHKGEPLAGRNVSGTLRFPVPARQASTLRSGRRVHLVVVNHAQTRDWLDGPARLSATVTIR
jgi:hypothetical protein